MCGSLEIDSAIDVVQGLSKSMDMYRREASDGKLLLLPGETVSAEQWELYSVLNMHVYACAFISITLGSSITVVQANNGLSCFMILARGTWQHLFMQGNMTCEGMNFCVALAM